MKLQCNLKKIEKYVVKRELLQEHKTDCYSELQYSFSMVSNHLLVIHHHHSFNLTYVNKNASRVSRSKNLFNKQTFCKHSIHFEFII